MALQIRRGPTADRMSYTPVVGELIWDTSTNSLYIGNGITPGGLPAGTLVTEDVQDIASTMLTSGTHQNITFTYDDTLGRINSTFNLSSFDGTINAAGFIGSHYANDSTLLLNALTGAVNLNGTVKGNIIPSTDIAYDLGSSSFRFRDLYLSGSSIKLGDATITSTGSAVNLPAGSSINGVTLGAGVEPGMNYNINIVGDDSTLIVNARTKSISAASLSIVNPVSLPTGSTLNGTAFGFRIATEDSTNFAVANGATLEIRGDQGIQTRQVGGVVYVSADITAIRPSPRNDETPAYITFVGNTVNPSYIGVDTTLRYIASTGTLEILNVLASTVSPGTINLTRTAYSPTSAFTFAQHHAVADAVNFTFYRSRGTATAPTAVQTGDDLADIVFNGWDGTAATEGASISAIVDGSVTGGNVPTRIVFRTNNGVTTANRAQVGADGTFRANFVRGFDQTLLVTGNLDGDVTGSIFSDSSTRIIDGESGAITAPSATLSSFLKLPVYADNTARDAAITIPQAGMMIFNTTGTKFQGYTGSAWVDLN
jgi:hypothetical protein